MIIYFFIHKFLFTQRKNRLDANWRTNDEFDTSTDCFLGLINPKAEPIGDLGLAMSPLFHKFQSLSFILLTITTYDVCQNKNINLGL